jgi:hypothetical protein
MQFASYQHKCDDPAPLIISLPSMISEGDEQLTNVLFIDNGVKDYQV